MGTELTGGASAPGVGMGHSPSASMPPQAPPSQVCRGLSFPTPILFRGHRRKTGKETVQSVQV